MSLNNKNELLKLDCSLVAYHLIHRCINKGEYVILLLMQLLGIFQASICRLIDIHI